MPATVEATSLEQIAAKLDDVLRRLTALKLPEQPALTKRAFAKLAGISPNTVFRRIADGTIATKHGRIPHSELRKFLS